MNISIFACSLDLFYFNDCINCPYIQKCNGILHFSKATKLLESYKEYFPLKYIDTFKGRFINTNRYKNYNLKKKYDILIYGIRNWINKIENHKPDQEYKKKWEKYHNKKLENTHHFYPLRTKIEKLLIKNKEKYNLKILEEKCIFNAKIANENLSKLINESYLTLATRTRSNIAMAKYFEIAGSYSTIIGNIPTDYNHLFKNNIIEVNEWMSDEQILNIIDKALENKEKLQEMSKRLGDIIHKEYNLNSCVKDMDEVFKKYLNYN